MMRTAVCFLALLIPFTVLASGSGIELNSKEMSEFVAKAEAHFVSEIGLPEECIDKRARRDSLSAWIPEGTSYDEVLETLEGINARNGFSFRIIRDKSYVCIERTYYRRRNGMAISLMVVIDEEGKSVSASLSRSLYKLPIENS